MIGQLTPPPAIPALYEFRLLLELLSDADKSAGKLKDLGVAYDRAHEATIEANAAIERAKADAREARDASVASDLKETVILAREIEVAARERDLSAKSKAYEDMCVERDAGYRSRVKELDAREAEIRDREANIEAKQVKADNTQAHASGLIGEYEAKLSQLKALVK